jgi:hypothetical protein
MNGSYLQWKTNSIGRTKKKDKKTKNKLMDKETNIIEDQMNKIFKAWYKEENRNVKDSLWECYMEQTLLTLTIIKKRNESFHLKTQDLSPTEKLKSQTTWKE